MKLLALDTSSDACTVALMLDDDVLARHETEARAHTRILGSMLESVREEAGTSWSELDAIVLGNGPGSFIGMRIAASVTQGLAFGAGLPVVPVSSLAAVALDAFDRSTAGYAAVTQDAHMQEVYFGLYRRGTDGLPDAVIDERLAGQERLPELDSTESTAIVAAGLGWHVYPELERANRDAIEVLECCRHPDARCLLRIGQRAFVAGEAVDPERVNPAYLRQKVASVPGQKAP